VGGTLSELPYLRMHGCGNDYVFLDCYQNAVPEDLSSLSRFVSDRHRAVGSDGLVLMLPSDNPAAVARMRMFNADGSEGSLCGNALRCMAMWLHQTGRAGHSFQIAMAERLIGVQIVDSEPTLRRALVRIDVGRPGRLTAEPGIGGCVRRQSLADVQVPGLLGQPLHVSLGNPHTVFFVDSIPAIPFERLGPQIERHSAFPDRTNVEFVEISDRSASVLTVRVWERGSGETLACGSGACAVAIAAVAAGHLQSGQAVSVQMAGGLLRVLLSDDLQPRLEGPAEECCRGTILWPRGHV
jgi:diaminopimelate epimerase